MLSWIITRFRRAPAPVRPHECSFEILNAFEHAPAGAPPAHTSFHLLGCKCGKTEAFPPENYLLVLPDWRASLNEQLVKQGYKPVVI